MDNIVQRVSHWLNQTQHVVAPLDWLEACISWIQEENGQSVLQRQIELNNFVLEQWLLADLKETGASCLPPEVVNEKKVHLNGSYCLQINSVKDISGSYYSQLQKVQGTENENVHVTATQFTQRDDDSKNTRMLMLELTDGSIDVKGIEYNRVRGLNFDVKLGTKIVVHGDILCRLGVLMLKDQNVTVLGGEVDAFIITREDILKQALSNKEQFTQQPKTKLFKGSGKFVKKSSKNSDVYRDVNKTGGNGKEFNNFSNNINVTQHTAETEIMDVNWEDDDFDEHLLLEQDVVQSAHIQANSKTVRSAPQMENNAFSNTSRNTNYNVLGFSSSSFMSSADNNHFNSKGASNEAIHFPEMKRMPDLHSGNYGKDGVSSLNSNVSTVKNERKEDDWDLETDLMFDSFDNNIKYELMDQSHLAEVKVTHSPITYICQLKDHLKTMKHCVKVKAYISTLLNKLDFNNGKYWSLKVKLNDGTGVIDASISDRVLSKLIGVTAQKCFEIKHTGSRPEKIQLSHGLKACQEHLIKMSPILELEVGGDLQIPCVQDIISVSDEHLSWFN